MATARHNGGERREGLDIGMLAVAALAAVAAALVTSKLWPGGTLISTAMTPVIVTLVKEWLRKPAERISAVSAKAPDLAARVAAPARGAPRVEPRTARAAEMAPPSVPTRHGERVVFPPAGSPVAETPPEETFVRIRPEHGQPVPPLPAAQPPLATRCGHWPAGVRCRRARHHRPRARLRRGGCGQGQHDRVRRRLPALLTEQA